MVFGCLFVFGGYCGFRGWVVCYLDLVVWVLLTLLWCLRYLVVCCLFAFCCFAVLLDLLFSGCCFGLSDVGCVYCLRFLFADLDLLFGFDSLVVWLICVAFLEFCLLTCLLEYFR